MASKYPSQSMQKIRALYESAQNQLNNNQLNRITEERMNKRYAYIAKQVQKKEQANDKENIQEMIFYRNKFHSLVVLVQESMRESYNKIKFQTQVKNILKDDWKDMKSNNMTLLNDKIRQVRKNRQDDQVLYKRTQSQILDPKKANQQFLSPRLADQFANKNKSPATIVNRGRSLSPLEQFFQSKQIQIQKSKKAMNFKSLVPKAQEANGKFLSDIKQMNKKSNNGSSYREKSQTHLAHEDSRLRDLRRENEQLQRILRKRQIDGSEPGKHYQNLEVLKKQVNFYQKANSELRHRIGQQGGYHNGNGRNLSPYQISYCPNNVNQITYRNLQKDTSRQAFQKAIDKSPTRSMSYLGNSKGNDCKSNRTNASSVVQKQKQLYINHTPQILFQNELIKVLVVRFPLRIQEKNITSSNEKLNPEDHTPNQQRLEVMVLNNASKYVKNEQLLVKLTYDYDRKHHEIRSFRKSNQGYSKVAETSTDIVYREVIKVKLLSRQGYNEEIKVLVNAEFSYIPDVKKKRIFNEALRDKRSDNFSIEVKLPVTFIQFSSRPFSSRNYNNRKTKLTIKPNPLYDTLQHTYMNTNLPFLKSSNPRVLKQHAVLFGRSFIHDENGKGSYLECDIELAWFEKKDAKYVSINTIEEWVYLLAYIFLDVQQQEEEFQKEFRKPSMHVFFNLQNKHYV